MRRGLIAVAAALWSGGCGTASAPAAGDAWVRLAAVPGRPAAAYFTLHGGATDTSLSAVAVEGAARTELHESRMAVNGQGMTMDAIRDVPVPAGGTVAFAPMGRHAMVFGIPATMTAGSSATISYTFADGSRATTTARVIGAGDPTPAG